MNSLTEHSGLSSIFTLLKDQFNKGISFNAQESVEQEPASVEQAAQEPLPYRTILKDKFNKMYADQLKQTYSYLPVELQLVFETFTKNLMEEEYISRHSLLDATADFYKIHFRLCDKDISAWHRFTDNAFNYRPYQGCG